MRNVSIKTAQKICFERTIFLMSKILKTLISYFHKQYFRLIIFLYLFTYDMINPYQDIFFPSLHAFSYLRTVRFKVYSLKVHRMVFH